MTDKRQSLDPDALLKKKFRALCRFRAIGRLVIENIGWLLEDTIDTALDVRFSIPKPLTVLKKKKLLTVHDKSLLFKPITWRTEKDEQYLYQTIGGIKSFRDYPKKVRRHLAAVACFKFYGPKRVIIKEGHPPNAMYFIIEGEIQDTKRSYDGLTKTWVDVDVGKLRAGDVFGQDSLLHDIPRLHTCTSLTPVELLCVMREDFKNVLQTTIQKQWDEIQDAMSQFTYFSTFSEIAIREGCMVAKIKNFKAKETIIGDGNGLPNFVYFILSGKCQLIETLYMTSTKIGHKTFFKLYDPVEEKLYEQVKQIMKDEKHEVIENDNIEQEKHTSLPSMLKFTTKDSKAGYFIPSSSKSLGSIKSSNTASSTRHREESLKNMHMNLPKHIKVFFMQVYLMDAGGCFGLGENMKNRRMVAFSEVKCLLLPRHWLWQWNPSNIWQRIKDYLDRKIPTTEKIFKEFKLNHKWSEYKNNIIHDILRDKKAFNATCVHDVPYSIRIENNFDFGKCSETWK